jgi:hypothetical protein
MIELRGMSKQQAAAYAGCETLSVFNDWIGRGIMASTKHDHPLLLGSCRRMMVLRVFLLSEDAPTFLCVQWRRHWRCD